MVDYYVSVDNVLDSVSFVVFVCLSLYSLLPDLWWIKLFDYYRGSVFETQYTCVIKTAKNDERFKNYFRRVKKMNSKYTVVLSFVSATSTGLSGEVLLA